MKATTLKKAALIAGSLSFLAGSAMSQDDTAVSGAGGYTTHNLDVGFNLLGVSLFDPVTTGGTLTGEADAVVTDSGAAFDTDLTDGTTYLLEILDGDQAGAVAQIVSWDATNLTLDGAVGAGNAAYQVRKAPTLNDIFGTSLAGAAFVGPTTDIVWLPDGEGDFNQYAYNSVGGEFRPTSAFFLPAASDVTVFYPDALFVQVADTAKDVVVTGMVKNTGTVVSANAGFNLTAVNAPVGQTFGNSGMEAFLTGAAFVGPTTDIVWLPDGDGGFDQYAYNTSGSQWRPTSAFFLPAAEDTALTSGMFIQRAGEDTAGVITVPDFYANL